MIMGPLDRLGRAVVKHGDKSYMVSTIESSDCGWETMIFPCDESGRVTSFLDVYCERYANRGEAVEGHARIAAEWKPE
jgi:hypothetical protein